MRWDYLFFDLDGTLTDPAEGICGCIRYALEKDGRPVGPLESYFPWIGPPLEYSFSEFAGAAGEDVPRLVSYYRERFSTVGLFENKVYPGIPEMLAALKAAGAHMAIATGKPTVFTERILEHFGLRQYFDCVFGITLGIAPESKAEVIRRGMEHMGVSDLSRCVMIGDRKHDVQGAKERGIECIGVLYGYGGCEELESAGAEHIVETVSALQRLLSE